MQWQTVTVLVRAHDDGSGDEARWRAFVERQAFGHLVASGAGRAIPVVVPTQFVLQGDTVFLHLAKQNPIFEALSENSQCVLSVAGDWAYIPGAWKAIDDEDPTWGIPTTYYGAVQLTCAATVIDDTAGTAGVLRTQRDALEPEGTYVDPAEHGQKLRAILGIEIAITDMRAKFKYGGNVDEAHRSHIKDQLGKRNKAGDQAALNQIQA